MSAVPNSARPRPTSPPGPSLAQGRFRSVAWSVLVLATVSLGLMAWSHQGWYELQQRAHTFDTLLSQVQLQARRAQILTEEHASGQAQGNAQRIDTLSGEALYAARQLQHMAPATLQPALNQLSLLLVSARQTQAERLSAPQSTNTAQLQAILGGIEQTAHTVATQWATELDAETDMQQRLDRLNMVLVGGVTLLLLALIARTQRQREHVVGPPQTPPPQPPHQPPM